ncbi:alpha-amylase family glycosyl hydrolase [Telmatobacter bradus]|uniref:alpha-amylase family glycosyl hydrolase n=1 Tax=Telmatobacter bradus TaxID=474953 RepID=UPI003B428F11
MRSFCSAFLACILVCASCFLRPVVAQGPAIGPAIPPSHSALPRIDQIDPPDWWVDLPSPMLLVHGLNLQGAHFTLTGNQVALERTQISASGHWAFLWLNTDQAAAQTLGITATNESGSTQSAYVLQKRTAKPAGFSASDVLYLIMTDRFSDGGRPAPAGDDRTAPRGWHGGTLAGITQHLGYLQALGVTTLWTTPVASNGSSPESYHGYAATDLYAIDPHFGTLDDYRHLADALHQRQMKLVIDLVPNHVSILHPWVRDPPAPEWFHGTAANHIEVQHDFYQLVDPHAAKQATLPITDGWFTSAMPDLNQSNPLVARYFTQNTLWWVETVGLDGIRLDTFPYVDRGFWRDFHATLHSVEPSLTTVGEIFHRDPAVTSYFAGGKTHAGIDTGLDTPFDFPLYFALRDVFGHAGPMTNLTAILRQDALYPHPERLVTFAGNHDTTRLFTELGSSTPRTKLVLGLLATLRGMPMLYSGDEIAMNGGEDPDNRHDFPGGFAGDKRNAFLAADRTATEQDLYTWTAQLLAFRATHTELQTGLEQNLATDADSFAFVRTPDANGCNAQHTRERLLIVVNRATQEKTLTLPLKNTALDGCTQFAAAAMTPATSPTLEKGSLRMEERPESMTVFVVR